MQGGLIRLRKGHIRFQNTIRNDVLREETMTIKVMRTATHNPYIILGMVSSILEGVAEVPFEFLEVRLYNFIRRLSIASS